MNRDILWSIIICALLAGCYVGPSDSKPAPPTPSPVNPVVPDNWGFGVSMPPLFAGKPKLAADVAAVCSAFADRVEFDGKQDEPNIVSTTDVFELFAECMSFDLLGGDPQLQPFGDLYGEELSKEIEPDSEAMDLTADKRKVVVRFYRAIAQALRGVK